MRSPSFQEFIEEVTAVGLNAEALELGDFTKAIEQAVE